MRSFNLKKAAIPVFIILAFITGYLFAPSSNTKNEKTMIMAEGEHQHKEEDGGGSQTLWTCSMHPQIKLPKPGKCPICFMDLIPLEDTEEDESEITLTMSESAKALAEIKTAPVERRSVIKSVKLSGKIDFDESRLSYVTAWIPGRIDKLYYDFTGSEVKKGSEMVYIYSPELLAAQEELLQAVKAKKEFEDRGNPESVKMAASILESAQKKLKLLGLGEKQVNEIIENGNPSDHITIFSPVSGTVINKNGSEGMYLNTGTRIYTIADLSGVWAWLDVYESDMIWLEKGQEVKFEVEAYPGETFQGKIGFIDPYMNEKSRTVRVRVNIPNNDRKLKPEMLVKGELQVHIPKGAHEHEMTYVEKYVCPMDCQEPKDEPGTCSVCKMKLVKGKVPDKESQKMHTMLPLVIPASAPLITGKRAVVYVEIPDAEKPTYEGRVIELGPRAGDLYIVKSGLEEGENVVIEGNFKIDSEMQIKARQSMMTLDVQNKPAVSQEIHKH
ncbi:efflux RND transporter periplasmic adaptor subunit [candidate division KSB1 bacterium]